MKQHEEFCAEIYRRRDKLIKKKRERRVVTSCLAFALCFAIIGVIGLMGEADGGRSLTGDEENTGALGIAEIQSVTVKLPDSDGAISVDDSDRLSRIVELINANEDSFVFCSSELLYTVTDNATAEETEETVCNIPGTSSTREGSSESTDESTLKDTVIPTLPTNVYGGDISVEASASVSGAHVFYAATLNTMLEDADKAYIFTFEGTDGELVAIALDTEKYPSLAEDIEDILKASN